MSAELEVRLVAAIERLLDDARMRARAIAAGETPGTVDVGQLEQLLGDAERLPAADADRVRDAAAAQLDRLAAGLDDLARELGPHIARRLADDELLGMLYVLTGSHPETPETRVRRALEAASHELSSVDVRFVDLESSGDSGAGSISLKLAAERGTKPDAGRVRGMIEMIVMTVAPDLEAIAVEIEGLEVADSSFIPLSRLRPSAATHEKCSLCARPIDAKHDHLYDPAKRELACTCADCALILPSSSYAAYRKIPQLARRVEVADIAGWLERLNVPVGIAALIRDDHGGARLAYPGPAGLVSTPIDPPLWAALCADVPAAAALAPEVEALVWSGLTREVLHTGIDVVFRLVGELRTHWRGITGGDGPAQLSRVLAQIVEAAA